MAQTDIDQINAWQEAEAVRLREEAARRIVARGEELDEYLVRHAAIIDSEVDQIEGAVANYQLELDGYFGKLTSESDPSEIARLADELPPPPDLAKVGGEARAHALAAVAAEGDAAFSPTAPGPELVPVMAPKNGSGAAADGGTSAGPTSSPSASPDKTNPAIRILRSIATLGAPSDPAKGTTAANGNGEAAPATQSAPAATPVDDIAVPTPPAPDPVEAAKD